MEHIKRTERLPIIAHMLTECPNRVYNYSEFCEKFDIAKSSVSEDIDIIAETFAKNDIGKVETIAGASGGVRFRPYLSEKKKAETVEKVCELLRQPGRLLPGGYLYTSDIAGDPEITFSLGNIISSRYYDKKPDFVLTMETKGIPLALMTAKALNVPLVIARRDNKAYEGSAVKISYVSGVDNDKIETMAISRRAVKGMQKTVIVDDFAKGGGTLQGMVEMMNECGIEVLGVEVMIASEKPENKLCKDVHALMIMKNCDRTTNSFEVVPGSDYNTNIG